jgi:hypothetical protein
MLPDPGSTIAVGVESMYLDGIVRAALVVRL